MIVLDTIGVRASLSAEKAFQEWKAFLRCADSNQKGWPGFDS